MKKTKKFFCAVFSAMFVICALISSASVAYAADANKDVVGTRSDVYDRYVLSFNITSTGNAICDVSYTADSSVFTYSTCTIKIQKQVFLFIWSDVAVNANKKWEDYSTLYADGFYHTHQLESTGKYRAVITLDIYGTGGLHDAISDTIERTYS